MRYWTAVYLIPGHVVYLGDVSRDFSAFVFIPRADSIQLLRENKERKQPEGHH